MVTKAQSQLQRVVVTGLGAVTPLALNFQDSWDALLAGRCGVGSVSKVRAEQFPCKVAAEVRDFNADEWLDAKDVRHNDHFTHYAVAAAKMAVADAQLDFSKCDPYRAGVIIGSGIGGLQTIESQSQILFNAGPRRVSPFMIPALITDMAGGIVAIKMGLRGPNFAAVSACSTGSHAIGEAYHFLRLGKADVMLSGGAEGSVNVFSFAGFCAMRAMGTAFNADPLRASRPFDAKRDGFVMGEGAGVLVLETLEHAITRGARIYCEIVAYATTCDASHITMPDLSGSNLAAAIKSALAEAGIDRSEVDYINAHGTSTPYNDLCETNACKLVWREEAGSLAISSTKGATGHMLGAAGGFESGICAKAIATGKIPPTINYEYPDPACDLNYTPNKFAEKRVRVAINVNLGFGGHNAVLVFREYVVS
ncbi:MAG: beta-ketoacyl-ACP synthase II [Puniceicoccales bacterium]|jgi:3-oxoacyl-[acyl-carrier-protein] synthase II|nr:beta-ketoacyl-ACP synthase II [Puniceicoccales bacterium]